MGVADAYGRQLLRVPRYMADLINKTVYGGEQVCSPESIHYEDTVQVLVLPYGKNASFPVMRFRDNFVLVSDDGNVPVFAFGVELQDSMHYAMPVRTPLYDSLSYALQVSGAAASYKKDRKEKKEKKEEDGDADSGAEEAEIQNDASSVRIKISREEFLSGFHSDDRLLPVVTVVLYLGDKEWTAPRSLHKMFGHPSQEKFTVAEETLRSLVPDVHINLVAPVEEEDSYFDGFHTDLGLVLKAVKYRSSSTVGELILARQGEVDDEALRFLRGYLGMPADWFLGVDNDAGKAGNEVKEENQMCQGLRLWGRNQTILGVFEALMDKGDSEQESISYITRTYDVTEEFVRELLAKEQTA